MVCAVSVGSACEARRICAVSATRSTSVYGSLKEKQQDECHIQCIFCKIVNILQDSKIITKQWLIINQLFLLDLLKDLIINDSIKPGLSVYILYQAER